MLFGGTAINPGKVFRRGFTGVFQASGNPVSNYSFSSSSGFDHTRPIPEPDAWAMVAAGFAALGVLQRRRRACPTAPRSAILRFCDC